MPKLDYKAILMIVLIPVFFVVLFYLKKDNKEKNTGEEGKEMILPDMEKKDSLTKTEIYQEAGKAKGEKEKLSLDDIYKMDTSGKEKKDSSRMEKKVSEISRDGNMEVDKKNTGEKKAGKKEKEKDVKVVYVDKDKDSGEKEKEKKEKEKQPQEVGGLGVFENKNADKENKDQGKDGMKIEGFKEARFEKDYTLKDGREVVLVNQQDFSYKDIEVDKFALFFGTVEYSSDRFYINVNTIKNVDNQKYRVSLDVYNTAYQEGLYYEYGQAEKSTRDVGQSGANDVSKSVEQNLVEDAIDEVSKSRKTPKLEIKAGELVYVKKNDA